MEKLNEFFISIGGHAIISLIFAEYINRIFWHTTKKDISPDDIPQWAIKLTAVGAIAVVTLICIAARKLGTRVAVVFITVKVPIIFLHRSIVLTFTNQISSLLRPLNLLPFLKSKYYLRY